MLDEENDKTFDSEYRKMLKDVAAGLKDEAVQAVQATRTMTMMSAMDILVSLGSLPPEQLGKLAETLAHRELIAGCVVSLLISMPAVQTSMFRCAPDGVTPEQLTTVVGKITSLLDVDADVIVMELMRP